MKRRKMFAQVQRMSPEANLIPKGLCQAVVQAVQEYHRFNEKSGADYRDSASDTLRFLGRKYRLIWTYPLEYVEIYEARTNETWFYNVQTAQLE